MLPLTIGLDHRLVDGYQTATMTRIFHESSTMIPPRRRQHTSVRFNAKRAIDRTGRKAEFVEPDHATGVNGAAGYRQGSPFPVRGAAGNQSGAEPRPRSTWLRTERS